MYFLIIENNKIIGFTTSKDTKNTILAPSDFNPEQLQYYYLDEKGNLLKRNEEQQQILRLTTETREKLRGNNDELRMKTDVSDSVLTAGKKIDILATILYKVVSGEEIDEKLKGVLKEFATTLNLTDAVFGVDTAVRDVGRTTKETVKNITDYYNKKADIIKYATTAGVPKEELTDEKVFESK